MLDDEFGNDDENEKEFEPTVDMIMNEFDDERTIEEEEAMGQEDEQEELNALEKEQDIPLEELLKLYGYRQPQNGNSGPEEKKSDVPEPEEEEECVVNRLNPRYSSGVSSPGRHVRTRSVGVALTTVQSSRVTRNTFYLNLLVF